MRRLLFSLIVVIALAGTPTSAFAWRWPADEATVRISFGQSLGGSFSRGVLLSLGPQPVYPVADGTVIFVSDGDPAGTELGVTVVIDHPRGFRSFYGHLQPGTAPEPGTVVTESTSIGLAGDSGASNGSSLYVSLLDTDTGTYVNPLLLLPPVSDDTDPVITAILAQTRASLYDLSAVTTLPSGEHTLIVECSDRWIPGGPPVAPYSVTVLVGGREKFAVTYEGIGFPDGFPQVQPGPASGHNELHTTGGGYIVGSVSIPVGRTLIEIVVRDFSGNEASVMVEIAGSP